MLNDYAFTDAVKLTKVYNQNILIKYSNRLSQ